MGLVFRFFFREGNLMYRRPEVIVFDLGKVILNFCHDRMCQQVATRIDQDILAVKAFLFQPELHRAYETGQISTAEVLSRLSGQFACDLQIDDLIQDLGDIFTLNTAIIPLIAGLKAAGWKTGILSNTCDAHWQVATRKFGVLQQWFDFYVLSFQVDAVKPDPEIYHSAVTAAQSVVPHCTASQLFFVDDLLENVEGARAAGLDAVLYTSVQNLASDLRKRHVDFNY